MNEHRKVLLKEMVERYDKIREELEDLELNEHPEMRQDQRNSRIDDLIWMMQGGIVAIASVAAVEGFLAGYMIQIMYIPEFGSIELSESEDFWVILNELLQEIHNA